MICFSAFFRLFALDIRASLGTNTFCFPFPFPAFPETSDDTPSLAGVGRASDSILSVLRRRFSFSLSTVHLKGKKKEFQLENGIHVIVRSKTVSYLLSKSNVFSKNKTGRKNAEAPFFINFSR